MSLFLSRYFEKFADVKKDFYFKTPLCDDVIYNVFVFLEPDYKQCFNKVVHQIKTCLIMYEIRYMREVFNRNIKYQMKKYNYVYYDKLIYYVHKYDYRFMQTYKNKELQIIYMY